MELFAKIAFFDILVVLRLDLSQISFNVVKNAFATQQLALANRLALYDLLARTCEEIKILRFFGREGSLRL